MAFYPDMGEITQIARGPSIRAVGWLDGTHVYPTGHVSEELASFIRKLCAGWGASTEALGWPVAAGLHRCELCKKFMAGGNLGIPGHKVLYVAPQMLSHYIDAHDYKPPQSFLNAVSECPVFGSPEYESAVAEHRSECT